MTSDGRALAKAPSSKPKELDRIREAVPAHASTQIIDALVRDGADGERAREAHSQIVQATAEYLLLGPPSPPTADRVRKDLQRVANNTEQLDASLVNLSPEACEEIDRVLEQVGPSARISDYIRLKLILPRLKPLLFEASRFQGKPGRKGNRNVHNLFQRTIAIWQTATDQPPTASQVDGAATAPLLRFIRQIVYTVTEDEELREALTDDVYLGVLAKYKRVGSPPHNDAANVSSKEPRIRRQRRKVTENNGA